MRGAACAHTRILMSVPGDEDRGTPTLWFMYCTLCGTSVPAERKAR